MAIPAHGTDTFGDPSAGSTGVATGGRLWCRVQGLGTEAIRSGDSLGL